MDPDDDDVIGTGNDARLKLFNQIADHSDAIRNKELEFEDVDTEEVKNPPYKLALDEEGEVVGDTKSEKIEKVDDKKYKLKVNGHEKEVSEQELLAIAQKVEAADEYLKQAKEAAERFDKLQIPTLTSAVVPEPSKPDVQEDDAALARALQMGTEEEAVQVIRKLRQPAINLDAVVADVFNRLDLKSSVQKFREDYKDIADDPNLFQLAIAKDQQLLQSGDKRSYWERYKSIGDEIRSWAGKIKPAETFEDKRERKAATVTPIRTASARAVQPSDDEQEESTSEIIARMARARGQ